MPADCLQEAAQPADVMGVAHPAAHFRLQDGQVAFQQRAGHAGQPGGRAGQGGEPGGEPGHGPDPVPGHADGQAGGQLPADVSLGQFPQPVLRDSGEAEGGFGLVDTQVAEPPGVPRVLGVPAGAERERLDAAARVEDERAPAAALPRWVERNPPFFGLFQQGRRARAGQDDGERVEFPGRQFHGLLVAAALQDVLHFQPEPGGQPAEVDVLLAGAGILAGGGELVRVAASVPLPPAVVPEAEHRCALHPQIAVADQACPGRLRRRRQRRVRCLPAGQVRAARVVPLTDVALAHSAGHRTVMASGDDACAQRQVTVPAGVGRRGELLQGEPGSPPSLPV